ncbi:MAG TPA: amidase [Gammaproteobacteria bacterium]|nr:amidase [Gammaproteobacteria bacterium]
MSSDAEPPGNDITVYPARELLARLRGGRLTSRHLLEALLERVERLNPPLNAVVTLDAERAREAADAADAHRQAGGPAGPLYGLPMTVKDTFETAGLRTTGGTTQYAEHVPETDAVAVRRLREAGAIVFGKTNTPAWAADLQTYNEVFGTTRNPWDPGRSCGGSSGGSAAALAAGLTPLELGSDIGGSIRGPAHYCGVYGHKPTWGIVPERGHIPGPPGTLAPGDLSVAGPLARSAGDLELMLEILAGPEGDMARGWRLELPPPRAGRLGDFRVAAWLDDPRVPVDGAVGDVLQQALDSLARAGARIDARARPPFSLAEAFRDYLRLLYPVTTAGLPQATLERLARRARELPPDADGFAARLARYGTQSHHEWLAANEARYRYRAAWAAFFRDCDVLLCPVTPVEAVPHDHSQDSLARTIVVNGEQRNYWEQLGWVGLATLPGLPATSAPAGRSARGLPVGIQIIGPFLEDRTCLAFARCLAEVIGGFEAPPGYG